MRRIEKGPEPPCLSDLRRTPGADWSSVHGTQKQEMRETAFREQRGLCAYCMSPLRSRGGGDMKIEHFHARSTSPGRVFEWGNLLGVCLGDVGVPESGESGRFHCDTHRGALPVGQQALDLHPAVFPPDVSTYFAYTNEGEIRPLQALPEPERAKAARMIEKLHLNIARLKRNRAAVIAALRAKLIKMPRVSRTRVKELLDIASLPDGEGRLHPYCQAAIHYLSRKMRQLGE